MDKVVVAGNHFRRVKVQGIQVRRLVYISKEEFRLLKVLRFKFLRRRWRFFEEQFKVGLSACTAQAGSVAKEQALQCATSKDIWQGKGITTSCFGSTNIIFTQNSLFYRWKRVEEYYKDLLDRDEDTKEKIRQVRELMYS